MANPCMLYCCTAVPPASSLDSLLSPTPGALLQPLPHPATAATSASSHAARGAISSLAAAATGAFGVLAASAGASLGSIGAAGGGTSSTGPFHGGGIGGGGGGIGQEGLGLALTSFHQLLLLPGDSLVARNRVSGRVVQALQLHSPALSRSVSGEAARQIGEVMCTYRHEMMSDVHSCVHGYACNHIRMYVCGHACAWCDKEGALALVKISHVCMGRCLGAWGLGACVDM